MRRVDGHSDGTTDTFTFCCPPFPDKHLYTAFGEGGLEPRLETSMNGSTSNTWILFTWTRVVLSKNNAENVWSCVVQTVAVVCLPWPCSCNILMSCGDR